MEPLYFADKLEVLRKEKVEFMFECLPKDLKNISKKDELLKQRVHIESDGVIEINMNKEFESHSKDAMPIMDLIEQD